MNQSISLLPLMPLAPAWIEQAAAFHHPDPRMLKAAIKLLFSAWRGSPAASIPASHSYIAETTGLAPELVAERYVVLTDGFELRDDGRLHHRCLATICAKMTQGYGQEIEAYAVAVAMAAQAPEQFSLMSMEAGRKGAKVRGKTQVPRCFGFDTDPDLRDWCSKNGYPAPNQQEYIMAAFLDWSNARGQMQKDWAAAFRNFARNELRPPFNRPPPPPIWPEGHPAAQPEPRGGFTSGRASFSSLRTRERVAKGDQAIDHNTSVMAAVRRSALRECL